MTSRQQSLVLRWSLVLAVLAGWRVTIAIARPAADFSVEPEDESAELSSSSSSDGPAVVAVPVRVFTDPNSAFGRTLHRRLAAMSDRDLSVLQSGLRVVAMQSNATAPADQEMMMGDMPSSVQDANNQQETMQSSSSSPPPDNVLQPTAAVAMTDDTVQLAIRESPDSEETEDRYRKLRIKTIQNQIINFMGWNTRASESSPLTKPHAADSQVPITTAQQRDAIRLLYENLNTFPSYPSDSYTKKTQSFYPICDLPRHTNEDVWNAKESMNLMFNISLHKVSNGITVNVNTAKLRLFKQLVSCNSQSSNETDDSPSCQPILLEDTVKRPNSNISTISTADIPLIIEDRQIRVSIYAYTRSLKRKRVKRKLLDSRMMPYYIEKWTEWNIRSAVKIWRREPTRNYGLSVEVEDEDGNLLPVHRFFKPMNCSGDAQMTTPKPIPSFLMDAAQYQHGYSLPAANSEFFNGSSALQLINFNIVHRYPMIDVTTIDVPDSEAHNAMIYQYAKNTFEHNLALRTGLQSASFRPDDVQNTAGEHRIRHNNQHRTDSSSSSLDADASNVRTSISKDGHEIRDQIIMQGVVQMNSKASSTEPLY